MVQGFDQVTDRLRQLDGFEGRLRPGGPQQREGGDGHLSSDAAAQASAQQADEMRSQMAQAGKHTIETVETYEVALHVDGG